MTGLGIRSTSFSTIDLGSCEDDSDSALERIILHSSSRSLSDLHRLYEDAFDTGCKDDSVISDWSKRFVSQSTKGQIPTGRLSGQLSPFKKQASMTEHLEQAGNVRSEARLDSFGASGSSNSPGRLERFNSQSPSKALGLKRPISMIELGRPPRPAPDWPLPPLPSRNGSSFGGVAVPRSRKSAILADDIIRQQSRPSTETKRADSYVCEKDFYHSPRPQIQTLPSNQENHARAASSTLPDVKENLVKSTRRINLVEDKRKTQYGVAVDSSQPTTGNKKGGLLSKKKSFLSLRNPNRNELAVNTTKASEVDPLSSDSPMRADHHETDVDLQIVLDRDIVVGLGTLSGRLIFHTRVYRQLPHLRIGDIKLKLVGCEQIATDQTRHSFYTLHQNVPTVMDGDDIENVDIEGFADLTPDGLTVYFDMTLVQNGLRMLTPCTDRKQGQIRYFLIASAVIKWVEDSVRKPIQITHDVKVYPRHDAGNALRPLPAPISELASGIFFMGGNKEATLKLSLDRDTWIAGQRLSLNIDIANNTSKKFHTLQVSLLQDLQITRDVGSESDEASAKSFKETISETVLRRGEIFHDETSHEVEIWSGILPRTECHLTRSILVPMDAVTVHRIKRMSVKYAVQVSISGSFGSKIHVHLPIDILNPRSLEQAKPLVADLPVKPIERDIAGRKRPIASAKSSFDLRAKPVAASPDTSSFVFGFRSKPSRVVLPTVPHVDGSRSGTPTLPAVSSGGKDHVNMHDRAADRDLQDLIFSPAFSQNFSMPSTSETGHSTISEASESEIDTPAVPSSTAQMQLPVIGEYDSLMNDFQEKPAHAPQLRTTKSTPNMNMHYTSEQKSSKRTAKAALKSLLLNDRSTNPTFSS